MRYLVIAACVDARSGKEFAVGDEFLPEPEEDQAKRLIAARCLRVIPGDAPVLPGTGDADRKIVELEAENVRLADANEELRGRVTQLATDAGAAQSAADRRIADLTDAHDAAQARVAELEADLAAATAPKPEGEPEGGDAPPSKASAKNKA